MTAEQLLQAHQALTKIRQATGAGTTTARARARAIAECQSTLLVMLNELLDA